MVRAVGFLHPRKPGLNSWAPSFWTISKWKVCISLCFANIFFNGNHKKQFVFPRDNISTCRSPVSPSFSSDTKSTYLGVQPGQQLVTPSERLPGSQPPPFPIPACCQRASRPQPETAHGPVSPTPRRKVWTHFRLLASAEPRCCGHAGTQEMKEQFLLSSLPFKLIVFKDLYI